MFRQLKNRIERPYRKRTARVLVEKFFKRLEKIEPSLFVEVGAYDGESALRARKTVDRARVVSFEANPAVYRHFSAIQPFAQNHVEYVHAAVSCASGEVEFHMLADRSGISKKSSTLQRIETRPSTKTSVPAVSLDDYFEGWAGSIAMWIDVEGAGRNVLMGGARVLSQTALLLMEVERRAIWGGQWIDRDVIRHLEMSGLKPIARDYEYRQQYNILFCRDA